MNKLESEQYNEIKLRNRLMRDNKIEVRYYVEKDFNGVYRLKSRDNTGNLPEHLELIKKAREVWNKFIDERKAQQIKEFLS